MADEKKIENLNAREAVARRNELLESVNKKYKEIGDENPTKEQVEAVESMNKDIETVERIIDESKEFREMKERHLAAYAAQQNGGASNPPPTGSSREEERKSVGERFGEFSPLRKWIEEKAGGPDKSIPDNMRVGESPAMEFDKKALIIGGSATSAGALVRRDYAPLVELPFLKLGLRDLVTNGTTQSDLIEYPRMVSRTVNAAVVQEASATAGVSGQKPESSLVLEKVTAAVKTIAHWIPATKRALSDAGQIRTIIDNFLMLGLEEVVEWELLNGDGTNDHLLGLARTPGTTPQAWDVDIFRTTRKARTKAEQVGLAVPNGYLLNPYDWEDIELQKDLEGRYYYGGPQVLGNPRLWGLPVVTSPKQVRGTGYCGDFKQMVVWDREQSNIRVSDSHSDFFTRNMVAILAEQRLANGVFRPAAIVEMDLFAGPNS